MRHELLSGRRLRFPVELSDRESIPGAVARGVRQHVLVRTAPVLEAAGVHLRHIGLSQIATPEELERLAFVARCPANDLIERAGERLVGRNYNKSSAARFGRLVIPRAYLEFNRRRIGPVTLESEPYHRASWMNLLLPYCPESLERLVDRCNHCEQPLGWFHSHGVEHCDGCGLLVDPCAEEFLPQHLGDEYRLFASLSSPDARAVEEACAQMPATLSALSPASLVRLVLLVGRLIHPDVGPTSARGVTRLPAPALAMIVCSATALLRSWPNGFRSWVAAQLVSLSGSPSALEALRAKIKRLADGRREPEDLVRAVTTAMPDLHRHAAHAFASDRRYYLYIPVRRMLGLSADGMAALKKCFGIKFLKLNTGKKEQGQFDVEQIDGLVPVFRDSICTSACAEAFRLPHYAIEQLCAAGLIEWEDHPVLLATAPAPKVRGASVRRLTEELAEKAQDANSDTDRTPADCVTLAVASRRIGGRLKPWASIIDALRTGRIDFWMEGDKPTITSIYIRAGEMARFDAIVDEAAPVGLAASTVVSQRDAAEILNLAPKNMLALCDTLHLRFVRKGPALVAPLADVLATAAKFIWNVEIAWHLGAHHKRVDKILTARGIDPSSPGWPRQRLNSEGIISQAPTDEDIFRTGPDR